MRSESPRVGPDRLAGLRRFAVAITVLNLLGHTMFGFEQSWAQPLLAVLTAYAMEMVLEIADSIASRRRPRFACGGIINVLDFFLSAHISGLAVSMLLYPNERLGVVAFGAACAIASKAVFRVRLGSESRHFFNPSNLGITVVLLLFPWVGIAPPYQFTADLGSLGGWLLPAVIICTGTFLNARFTKRLPLIAAWVGFYAAQAVARWIVLDTPVLAGLAPMTGVAFVLFTFYMITDPATTPSGLRHQVYFGAAVAAVYTLLVYANVVFGMFFALSIVCAVRGTALYIQGFAVAPRVESVKHGRGIVTSSAAAAGNNLAVVPVETGGAA